MGASKCLTFFSERIINHGSERLTSNQICLEHFFLLYGFGVGFFFCLFFLFCLKYLDVHLGPFQQAQCGVSRAVWT